MQLSVPLAPLVLVLAALPVPTPDSADLVGKEFSIEALVIPAAPDTVINPTNVWRAKIRG